MSAVLIFVGVVVFLATCRQAYREAKEADRLEALKGYPKRRYNESGARFEWWD